MRCVHFVLQRKASLQLEYTQSLLSQKKRDEDRTRDLLHAGVNVAVPDKTDSLISK